MGSGPFKFEGYETGQEVKGVRNPDYYDRNLPYLDGFVGIFAPKQATRVEAIRSDRAAIGRPRRLSINLRPIKKARSCAPEDGYLDVRRCLIRHCILNKKLPLNALSLTVSSEQLFIDRIRCGMGRCRGSFQRYSRSVYRAGAAL